MNTSTLFSNERNDWNTPRALFDVCDREVGMFDIDAAATNNNKVIGPYIGPDHDDPQYRDALAIDWNERMDVIANVWLNPPYSLIKPFMAKCVEQSKNCVIWALVPARTDTRWWWDSALKAIQIRFLPGRLRFEIPGKASAGAPFPSAIVIFGPMRLTDAPVVKWWNWKLDIESQEQKAA
jgi:phage N-6-adenine-methyltransferase